MRIISAYVVALAACTGQAPGTILDGTLTFSPATDPIDKFETIPDKEDPLLVELDESTLRTGNCSMLVLQGPDTNGGIGWQFAAPAGRTFQHVTIVAPVTLDPRARGPIADTLIASATGTANIDFLPADPLEPDATGTEIDSVVGGQDQIEVFFHLVNQNYTSDLERIYTQALRQCPGDAPPFSITATFD